MFGYIYITTNTINNKQYIGKHVSSFFDPSYQGSGSLLRKAINKYGKDNFVTELVEQCETLEELNDAETRIIEKYDAVRSNAFYNLLPGGDGGDTVSILSDDKRLLRSAAISAANTGSRLMHKDGKQTFVKKDEIDRYINEGYSFGYAKKRLVSDDLLEKRRQGLLKYYQTHEGHMSGRTLTDEQRIKIGDASRGRTLSEETRLKISKSKTGQKLSDDCKQKLSELRKGKPKSESHRRNIGLAHKGKPKSEEQKRKLSEAFQGTVWMNNGTYQKQVHADAIPQYELEGFVRGMLKKKTLEEGD